MYKSYFYRQFWLSITILTLILSALKIPIHTQAGSNIIYLNYPAKTIAFIPQSEQPALLNSPSWNITNPTTLSINSSALDQLNFQLRSYLLIHQPEILAPQPANINLVLVDDHDLTALKNTYAKQLLATTTQTDLRGATLINHQTNELTIYMAVNVEVTSWDETMTYNYPGFDTTAGTGREILHQTLVHELIHANSRLTEIDTLTAETVANQLDGELTNLFQPTIFTLVP